MRLISLLVVVAIIAIAVWFLFFRDDDGLVDITPKAGSEPAEQVQPQTQAPSADQAQPAHQPTTTYGRALNYSTTTVQNTNDSHNAALDAAMK